MSINLLNYLAKLPFSFIYRLSDILYYIVYYVAGYRKKVVNDNLKNAFPDRSNAEITQLSKQFFRFLCDLTLEVVKMNTMEENEFNRHLEIKNPELLHHYFDQKKSVVVLTMHYANWEWSSFLPTCMKHKSIAVFKPLHNLQYNEYINENRQRFGAEMVPTHQ